MVALFAGQLRRDRRTAEAPPEAEQPMKAIVYDEFGPPDVLKLVDMDPPVPKAREVLLKVHAAAANPLDWHFIRGEPGVMRLGGKPKAKIPGADVAGTVETVGADVRRFRRGDEVFGTARGSFAEYACADEDRLALKPIRVSFEHAAAIPVAGVTALQALRNYGRLQAGQSVLVNGASGGVGTFAVQIATAFGARVTGVCSARNLELVRSLGAEHVIDYATEDFTRQPTRYDLILNVAGNVSVADARRALSPRGTLLVIGAGVGRQTTGGITMSGMLALGLAALTSRFGQQRVSMVLGKAVSSDDLAFIAKLVEDRNVTPVIDRTYALAEAPEAIRYLEAGHVRGKVLVTPGPA
jgi:NADPH:quinone reductase-like Zn-dependent oxidoreductase